MLLPVIPVKTSRLHLNPVAGLHPVALLPLCIAKSTGRSQDNTCVTSRRARVGMGRPGTSTTRRTRVAARSRAMGATLAAGASGSSATAAVRSRTTTRRCGARWPPSGGRRRFREGLINKEGVHLGITQEAMCCLHTRSRMKMACDPVLPLF